MNEGIHKMNIMIIIDLLSEIGGAERNLYQLSHALRNKGHRIIICSLKSGNLSDHMKSEGFDVINLNIKRIYDWKGIRALFALTRIVLKERVSIMMTYHNSSDFMGVAISLLTGIPIISSRRDMGFMLKKIDYSIYRLANIFFSAITTVSNAVKDQVILSQKANPEKIFVIYNGIGQESPAWDTGDILPDKGEVNICCLANIKTIKGQKVLIQAAHTIIQKIPQVRFFLVGNIYPEPDYYQELVSMIRNSGMEKQIIFTGMIEPHRTLKLWSEVDVAVCPSLSEGMSNAILEAMVAGKPVVATSVGGNPEVIKDGINGFLVPPDDPEALADALLRIIENGNLRDVMGRNSQRVAAEEFSLELMYERYEDLMKWVVSGHVCKRKVRLKRWFLGCSKYLFKLYKQGASAFAYYSGLNEGYLFLKEKLNLGRPKILCFHDVSYGGKVRRRLSINIAPDVFEKAITYIKEKYELVSLEKAVGLLEKSNTLKKDVFAITFDDCYKGWHSNILPISLREKIPFTVFVSVDPLDTSRMLFYDALIYMAENTWRKVADLSMYGQGVFSLTDFNDVQNFLQVMNRWLKDMPDMERQKILGELESYFHISLSGEEAESILLNWEELIEIFDHSGNIGAHSISHSDMMNMDTQCCLEQALSSKDRLEKVLGNTIRYYAYPYGNIPSQVKCIEEAGFTHAFTIGNRNKYGYNPFIIPRISVNNGIMIGFNGEMNKALLAVELSGLGDILFFRWLKPRRMKEYYES